MALFPAVVVKTARERVDGDHYLIKLAADGQRWWEPTCNVYDIVVPESAAANADGSVPRSVPPMCDGVHRSHFVETANDEFDRRRECAITEKARLDQDATRIADKRCVRLGSAAGTPGVVGLLSHASGAVGTPLQHYHLCSSLDGHAADDTFRALGCIRNFGVPRRKGAGMDHKPNRCQPCQLLRERVGAQMKRVVDQKRFEADVNAAASPADKVERDTARNTLLSSSQLEDKMKRQAAANKKLQRQLQHARKCAFDLVGR